MDNHWYRFSLLESAEKEKGLRADMDVALLLLARLVFVKYLEQAM